jgi:hypothetical protein
MMNTEQHGDVFSCNDKGLLHDCRIDQKADIARPNELQACSLDQSLQAQKLYTPLADWQIRILALYPGSPDVNIKAALRIAALHGSEGCILLVDNVKIQYEALSYCWGKPLFVCEIECNGLGYPVTENLHTGDLRG